MRHMKLLVVLMFSIGLLAVTVFALNVSGYIPFNIG